MRPTGPARQNWWVHKEPALRIMTLAMQAGEVMLENSVSTAEVDDALRRILVAVGLGHCEVLVSVNTIQLSYLSDDLDAPLTLVRVVPSREPDIYRLVAVERLVQQIERAEIGPEEAHGELDRIAELPAPYPAWLAFVAGLASTFGWAIFAHGDVYAGLVAALAAVPVLLVFRIVASSRIPDVFASVAGAMIFVAVPYLFVWAGFDFRVAGAVVGGLFTLVPGAALVASVQDGLSGSPLSSLSRGLQAGFVAVGLALGVLIALRVVNRLGIESAATEREWPISIVAGAIVLALGALAIARYVPLVSVPPTIVLGLAAFGIVEAGPERGIEGNFGTFVAAMAIGVGGQLFARLQRTAPSVYTPISILVLVPGFTIYLSMFAFAQGANDIGAPLAGDALRVALAIAAGVALGVAIGRNVPDPRPRLRRWRPARAARPRPGDRGHGNRR